MHSSQHLLSVASRCLSLFGRALCVSIRLRMSNVVIILPCRNRRITSHVPDTHRFYCALCLAFSPSSSVARNRSSFFRIFTAEFGFHALFALWRRPSARVGTVGAEPQAAAAQGLGCEGRRHPILLRCLQGASGSAAATTTQAVHRWNYYC